MRKLSSGLRISRAADDAAGLSIANKLRTQSRALNQAAANAEQGSAMLSIAEGAASTIQRIVERQKELLVQLKNETGQGASASTAIDNEITKLSEEITRIANSTTYQGTTVFGDLTFQVADVSTDGSITVSASLDLTDLSLDGSSELADADTALDVVNSVLASIGTAQNVLDFTTQNLKAAVTNVRAAESTIRDVDMAEEMANFTRNSILKQAAEAMLSQANQSSQGVLSLLR